MWIGKWSTITSALQQNVSRSTNQMTSPPMLPDWALQTYEWVGFTNGNTGKIGGPAAAAGLFPDTSLRRG